MGRSGAVRNRIYLESIDEEQNRRRWYRLSAEVDLFGGVVVCEWGRIGRRGRRLEKACATYREARKEIRRILRIRERHGYRRAAGPSRKRGIGEGERS
jgi:predicted DNA-binding WGR domain protein